MKKLKTNITLSRYIVCLIRLIVKNPKSYKYKVSHSLDFEGKGYFMTINGTKEANLIIPCDNEVLKHSDELLIRLRYLADLLKTHPHYSVNPNSDLHMLASSAERLINKIHNKDHE